jgi:dTDP-4-amino-4,6-dideoxygalactose transaminase
VVASLTRLSALFARANTSVAPAPSACPTPVARPPGRRFIPVLPTLAPSLLRPRLRAGPAPFPLGPAPEVRRFYFARNGVWLAARLLELSGSEVLVPAYHHGVEVEALVAAGAVPRFVRVDGAMRLDVGHLEASIGPRTRALYVIHYLGFPQPMDDILDVARRHGLPVVEDCALALLSRDGEAVLGARGDMAVFCLYKTLPVPNGGLLVLNGRYEAPAPARGAPLASTLSHAVGGLLAHAALRLGPAGEVVREVMRELLRRAMRPVRRATGLQTLSTGTDHFDPESADVGMSRVSRLVLENLDHDRIVGARRRNFALLLARLRDLAPPVQAELPPGTCPLFYPLVCEDKLAVAARLAAHGVETVNFWSVGHPACDRAAFPEVDALRRRVLELPIHQDLTDEDMAHVAAAVEEAMS